MGGKRLNNRRGEFEIISTILDLSKNGAKKTEILYKGNFSHNRLREYLTLLITKNFMEKKTIQDNGQSSNYFIITDRGKNLLIDINKALSHFDE